MKKLVQKYVPTAPKLGLYVVPDIPQDKLGNAIGDYARGIRKQEVLALYDCTLMGSAKDGAVFLLDRLVYQNNDLEPPQTIRYDDIVQVRAKRKFLGGKSVNIEANRANATVTHKLDFSGRPDAAEYVVRFLKEAMMEQAFIEEDLEIEEQDVERDENLLESRSTRRSDSGTDVEALKQALQDLYQDGKLSEVDYIRLVRVIGQL